MPYRASIYFVLITLCVGSLPLNALSQRNTEPSHQAKRLSLSTKRVNHPDGKVVDSLTGRFQKNGKTLNLSGYIVKKGLRPRRTVRRNKNPSSLAMFTKASFFNHLSNSQSNQDPPEIAPEEGPYDPGYDYYYAFSSITQPDGTVLAQAVYEYQNSTGENSLYLTMGGVTVACNLITEEATPLSPADEAQFEAWATSQDADMVRDASVAIIEDGPSQSASQLLLNYFALAMFVDTAPTTASGPRVNRSQKNALHHAVTNLRTPIQRVGTPCPNPKIVPFLTTSIAMKSAPALGALITSQCFGCCGIRCACIYDRNGNTIIGPACFDHDACVNQFGYTARQCMGKFLKAVSFVWWRWM